MELFGTAGIRGSTTELVTPALARKVGRAAAEYSGQDDFVVARDGRVTGSALVSALVAGLESGGASVDVAGQLPTPALAYASQGRHGVMLTASHNPPMDNGIKLFADGQEFARNAEREIEVLVEQAPKPTTWSDWTTHDQVDLLADYRQAVVDYAQGHGDDLDGMTVAVDCGNGVAGLATPQVLTTLGGEAFALNANVDGHFPARESKPTPKSLADLRAYVAEGDAELGIGHDGDADRIVVLDADGEVVHEDTILAILAEHYTRRSSAPDPVVVTTPNASARIDERVRDAGGRIERVRLGALHEGVASAREAGTEETEVAFAAEPWKHTHTAFGPWMDAVLSAAVLARLVAAEGLDTLREPITERPYRKVSVSCPDDRKEPVMELLERELPDQFPEADVDTEYGIRLELPDGSWTLVRPSGTEPYIRIYAESEDVDSLVAAVRSSVENAV